MVLKRCAKVCFWVETTKKERQVVDFVVFDWVLGAFSVVDGHLVPGSFSPLLASSSKDRYPNQPHPCQC